jgi:hypothetical protein
MGEPIKLPPVSWKGIDYTYNNLSSFASVKMLWNTVTYPMHKKHSVTFIGLKEFQDEGDILELGIHKILYRVIKHHQMTYDKGNLYIIKRVDNSSITEFDTKSVKVGQKFRVKNRKSFDQLFSDFLIFKDHE